MEGVTLLLRVAVHHVHRTAANPTAAIPRTIIVWDIRPSIDRAVMAPLELLALLPPPLVVVLVEAPLVVVPGVEVELLALGVATTGKGVVTTMDDAVVGVARTDVVPTDAVLLADKELAPVGGGLAAAGFASAPLPQGMA